jgi:lysophospholipase L1-like esterase
LLVIGDSFVKGVGDTHGGWAARLSQLSATPIDVSGQGGNTSDDLVQRMNVFVGGAYSQVLVQIGLNDSRIRPSDSVEQVPEARFRHNLLEIAKAFQATGAAMAFLGLTHVDEARTRPFKVDKEYRNDRIDLYDGVIRDVTRQCDAAYVPVPKLADDLRNLSDGLHPSPRGHEQIVAAVAAHLRIQMPRRN